MVVVGGRSEETMVEGVKQALAATALRQRSAGR